MPQRLTLNVPAGLATRPRLADGLTFLAGILLALSFAPVHLVPFAFLSPAFLFLAWQGTSAPRAAWRGFLFGLGFFGTGVSWVYVSLHHFGNMPAPLAALATLLFVAFLSLYFVLLGFVQARALPVTPWLRFAVGLPALWVLFEWWRGWLLTGFPWLNLGYGQTDTPLFGMAPFVGVYGVSWAVAQVAGLLALLFLVDRKSKFLGAGLTIAVFALSGSLSFFNFVTPAGAPITIAVVQGNVPLTVKWRPDQRDRIVDHYLALSRQANSAQLIVWPEAAIPGYLDQVEPAREKIATLARERRADVLFGVIERNETRTAYFNSVARIGVDNVTGSYRKQHLVPFGEFLPLKPYLAWLLQVLQIPMSDFSSGTSSDGLLRAAGHPVGVSVCYEDAFGEEIIRALPKAAFLVNVSEDAWFGNSLAPWQRLQMARFRARETGRFMLRAANTGPSAVIDAHGAVRALAPAFKPWVLSAQVEPLQGATAYVRAGNAPAVAAAWAAVLLAFGARWHVRRKI